uniref:Tyramine beta-hydroxylase n=1 Tax=Romanomermis culicivorax TaxID=13658 RepID=A0A915KXG4_ROMCU
MFQPLTYPFKIETTLINKSSLSLDGSMKVSIHWVIDQKNRKVHFSVETKPVRNLIWLAVGFSDHGDYEKSDLCVFENDQLTDSHVDKEGVIEDDDQQDCVLESSRTLPDGRMTIFYNRKFKTGDPDDMDIEFGTTLFVVAAGESRRKNLFGDFVRKTVTPNRILQSDEPPPKMDRNTKIIDITVKNISIPPVETTYWCTVQRLPRMFRQKHHIVKFEAVVTPENVGIVHHMEVYHCDPDQTEKLIRVPKFDGPCTPDTLPEQAKFCRKVIGAWAMGAKAFDYPNIAGIPFGGPNYFPFVMIEIHYNNFQFRRGRVDNSGIRFYFTDKLRKYDAGILETGLEYTNRMAIPPGQTMFPLSGYCMSECTDRLHSHLTGREIETIVAHEGRGWEYLNTDRHYSPHWQEIRLIKPVTVYPGDSLITTCRYVTTKKNNVTFGGLSISDEMCVNYMHYYPYVDLEACKSAVDPDDLSRFFDFFAIKNNSTTSQKYSSIDWNEADNVAKLHLLYKNGRHKPECRRKNGELYQMNYYVFKNNCSILDYQNLTEKMITKTTRKVNDT